MSAMDCTRREGFVRFQEGDLFRQVPFDGLRHSVVQELRMGRRVEVAVEVGRLVEHIDMPFGVERQSIRGSTCADSFTECAILSLEGLFREIYSRGQR